MSTNKFYSTIKTNEIYNLTMINLQITTSKGVSISQIRALQKKLKRVLPSDYVYLLLNYYELMFSNDRLGVIYDGNEEVGVIENPLLNLALFEEANNKRTEDAQKFYRYYENDVIAIGTLMHNGVILMGCHNNNVNQIFIDIPQQSERVQKVAEDYFEFLNEIVEVQ